MEFQIRKQPTHAFTDTPPHTYTYAHAHTHTNREPSFPSNL